MFLLFFVVEMPEAVEEAVTSPVETKLESTGKEGKVKKSLTANGLSSFTRGKLVLARVNMLDGTINDLSIEVCGV